MHEAIEDRKEKFKDRVVSVVTHPFTVVVLLIIVIVLVIVAILPVFDL